jgi:polysaccharide biosynthesis transport protein
MTDDKFINDDEIDLTELLASLISEWRTITVSAVLFAVSAFVYASFIANPSYEAKSVFAFEKGSSGGLGNLGGAAALLGISAGSISDDKLVFDRVTGRDFIISLAEENGLYQDPYFNPSLNDDGPGFINLLFGSAGNDKLNQEIIDAGLVGKFTDSVQVTSTKNNSIETIVTHPDPVAAAKIANAVVNKILEDTLQNQIDKSLREVDYLGEQLSKVQTEMDDAVMRLQEFSINRNALSIEELVKRSTQLVKLRESRDTTQRMLDAVNKFANAVDDADEKQNIIKNFPEILSSDFRLLAQLSNNDPEIQDLNADRLNKIVNILANRINDIDGAISTSETNAKMSAEEASDLLKLQRDLKVHEATYQILVQQYESSSLLSGYKEANGTILQVAVPAIQPSSPNKKLIIALGLVLGTFIGFGIALVKNIRTGRLHTIRSISDILQASKVITLSKKSIALEIATEISLNSKYVLIWPIFENSSDSIHRSSQNLLKAWSDAGLRTGYIYVSMGQSTINSKITNAHEIRIDQFSSHLLRGDLIHSIEKEAQNFDRVLIICEFEKTPVRAISEIMQMQASLVVIAKVGETLKSDAEKVRPIAQPDILLLG